MAKVTNFFVGANSGAGFQNLFGQMVDLENTYDFILLKGGPGVGKNTFMREIGRSMEQAGTIVEYLWCSGDPDSLDGIPNSFLCNSCFNPRCTLSRAFQVAQASRICLLIQEL